MNIISGHSNHAFKIIKIPVGDPEKKAKGVSMNLASQPINAGVVAELSKQ